MTPQSPNELGPLHWAIIDELRAADRQPRVLETRIPKAAVRAESGLGSRGVSKQTLANRLQDLALMGYVTRPDRGVYRLTRDPAMDDRDPLTKPGLADIQVETGETGTALVTFVSPSGDETSVPLTLVDAVNLRLKMRDAVPKLLAANPRSFSGADATTPDTE